MNHAVGEMFNKGRSDEINRSAFLWKKSDNAEKLNFQLIPTKEEFINPNKIIRLEKINRSRNGIIIKTLNSADIFEIVICGGVISEVFESFFLL